VSALSLGGRGSDETAMHASSSSRGLIGASRPSCACLPRQARDGGARTCREFPKSGAAQESNLPSDGLRRLTGFEGLLRKVQLSTEAGFRPRFSASTCGEVR
jgi:hypothetical protein